MQPNVFVILTRDFGINSKPRIAAYAHTLAAAIKTATRYTKSEGMAAIIRPVHKPMPRKD